MVMCLVQSRWSDPSKCRHHGSPSIFYNIILQNFKLILAVDNMPLKWVFHQYNDPKHNSRLAQKWFRVNGIEVICRLTLDLLTSAPLKTVLYKEMCWKAKHKKNNEVWSLKVKVKTIDFCT